jgi:hypothetical protein
MSYAEKQRVLKQEGRNLGDILEEENFYEEHP